MNTKNGRRMITEEIILKWKLSLAEDEKSANTIEKYLRDVRRLMDFFNGESITREKMLEYKARLIKSYAPVSVNSMLVSANRLFGWLGWSELKVKTMRLQRQLFCPRELELSRGEYERLICEAKKRGNRRLSLIIQTIGGTGIRISELEYITVEAARAGEAQVSLKGKTRKVFIVNKLRRLLLEYAGRLNIKRGPIFITRSGRTICRTNVWKEMKALCSGAKVSPEKVFPHNLRHLFARIFYSLSKDIVKLGDILGHSDIETTRIYIISTGEEHQRYLKRMGLVT